MYTRPLRMLFPAAAMLFAAASGQQVPFGSDPFGKGSEPSVPAMDSDKPVLSSLLTVDRSLSIFYDYLRESTGLVERLSNSFTTTTMFVPQNAAIISMARKPHQGPDRATDNVGRFETQNEEKERAVYLEHWVKSHMISGTEVGLEPGTEYETLAGGEHKISFAQSLYSDGNVDWQSVLVQPGNARIVGKKEAKDGIIYILDSPLS